MNTIKSGLKRSRFSGSKSVKKIKQNSLMQKYVDFTQFNINSCERPNGWTDVYIRGELECLHYRYPKEIIDSCSEDVIKIASFDLDNTLITTQSKRNYSNLPNDWRLLAEYNVQKKLNELHQENFKIIIFNNQKGISMGMWTSNNYKTKLTKILTELDVPCTIVCSTGDSVFRKPLPGMWEYIIEKLYPNKKVDASESFYVGDSAGRFLNPLIKKKDHSCADRIFAMNLNLNFYTPEEYFLKSPIDKFILNVFDPKSIIIERYDILSTELELVLLIGPPQCGKTAIIQKYFNNYDAILNTFFISQVEENISKSLENGKSVVVHNVADVIIVKKLLSIARKFNIICRAIQILANDDILKHNHNFQALLSNKYTPYRSNHVEFTCNTELQNCFFQYKKIDYKIDPDTKLMNLYLCINTTK